jgi:hypothetical protein
MVVLMGVFLSGLHGFPVRAQEDGGDLGGKIQAIIKPINDQVTESEKKIADRTARYIADLEALQKNVASDTGDLDAVLKVRKEREAWESGKPTPAFDPKDESLPISLRKLRYYFDQELKEIKKTEGDAFSRTKGIVLRNLDALEKEYTRMEDLKAALTVRGETEKLTQELRLAEAEAEPGAEAEADSPEVGEGEDVETPEFSPLAPKEAVRVTPKGGGGTLTLDAALEQAEAGQTLALAAGKYPPSTYKTRNSATRDT